MKGIADFKALGIPAKLFKSMAMSAVKDAVAMIEAVEVDEEMVMVDVDQLLASQGMPLRMNLTSVKCRAGSLVIEAGKASKGMSTNHKCGNVEATRLCWLTDGGWCGMFLANCTLTKRAAMNSIQPRHTSARRAQYESRMSSADRPPV